MLSLKRLLCIVLMVSVLGGISLCYIVGESRLAGVPDQRDLAPEREFMETMQVDEEKRPRVWILGDSEDERYGEIYSNVTQFCEDIRLAAVENERLDVSETQEQDLVIFCDASISRYADMKELEKFIAGGGRVILAAGLAEKAGGFRLWPVFGIREKAAGEDCHELVFEKPLLPVQPEQACYDGNSGSAKLEVDADASVYIRDAENDVPILYTYAWQEGGICLINGTFLSDNRCMGLLTGAIGALLPDFIYPVLGVKAVSLDDFPTITPAGDKLCKQMYGYSAEGFIRDVMWPAFQGVSLRTDTPVTADIQTASSSYKGFGTVDGTLLTTIGKSVLQFGGELVYAAEGPEDGDAVFPAATAGNSMEDGNLFAVCSVLGAYGMVSHAFDVGMLIDGDEDTIAWDTARGQIGLFESEVLARVPWLEGRTLTQAEGDVKSYQDLDYGWTINESRVELDCSGAAEGQAFFYHTDKRIVDAGGLTYEDVGNGYYLLRIRENHGFITLEEGE